jgi:hypothetical protein
MNQPREDFMIGAHKILLSGAMLLLLVAVAGAEQRVITFDALPTTTCNDPWIETNCQIEAVTQTAADCYPVSPGCFISQYSGGIYLAARLNIALTTMIGIETIEIDILEGWDVGCTRAFLYSGGTQVDYTASNGMGAGMLALDATGPVPDRLAISGHDCAVLEVRLIGFDITPATGTSWGTMKSLY